MQNALLKLLVKDTRQATLQQKSTWKKGNETSEERETRLQWMRQTGSGKFRGERLNITADKDQPARKVSSWNQTRNNITAEKHQPMREWLAVETPPGERIEIRVLKYKVQRTTAYAATTLTLSTVFHSNPRCHANMVTLDTPTCSTCSERFPAWLSFTQSLMNFCVLIWTVVI